MSSLVQRAPGCSKQGQSGRQIATHLSSRIRFRVQSERLRLHISKECRETQPAIDPFPGGRDHPGHVFHCPEPGALGKARASRRPAEARGSSCARACRKSSSPLLNGSREQLRHIVERFGNRERLAGVIVYDANGKVLAESSTLVTRYTAAARAARPRRKRTNRAPANSST